MSESMMILLGVIAFGSLWALLSIAEASRRVDIVIAVVLDARGDDD